MTTTGAATPADGVRWVQDAFPLVGPFTAESVVEAGWAVAELTRYLAHATHRPGAGCLRYAPDVYRLLGALTAAARSMDQVCQQVSEWLTCLAGDLTLRTDELGAAIPADDLAAQAGDQTELAAERCAELAALLAGAHSAVSRLYHEGAESGGGEHG